MSNKSDKFSALDVLESTVKIITTVTENSKISPKEVIPLLNDTYRAIEELVNIRARTMPAVPLNEALNPDAITCLECGKKYKSLKRHIRTSHDLSPEQYREKWSLAANYPMTAPGYAAKRSKIAKNHGLGKQSVIEPDIGSGQVDGTANLKSNSKKNQLNGSFHNRALRPSPVP